MHRDDCRTACRGCNVSSLVIKAAVHLSSSFLFTQSSINLPPGSSLLSWTGKRGQGNRGLIFLRPHSKWMAEAEPGVQSQCMFLHLILLSIWRWRYGFHQYLDIFSQLLWTLPVRGSSWKEWEITSLKQILNIRFLFRTRSSQHDWRKMWSLL